MKFLKIILALVAIVVCCGNVAAAEKSYRIAFADNGTNANSTSELSCASVNRWLSTYLAEGGNYVTNFDSSSFNKIYRAKKGMGWIIGSPTTSAQPGCFTMNLNESGQVNVTKIKVSITSGSNYSRTCAVKVNDGSEVVKSKQMSTGEDAVLTFTFSGEKLETLYISNGVGGGNGIYFYLHYIEVFYEEAEEEVTDPEMKSDSGSFSSNGADFTFGDSRLRFDQSVTVADGSVTFSSGNRLTISAPEDYFLAGVDFGTIGNDATLTASSGSVTGGKWLPAQSDIALNTVVYTSDSDIQLSTLKISYLPFRIDHSATSSTIDFAATETTANSINIHSLFANSGNSKVERFIIRANGTQIAELQPEATEVSFTSLPYLTSSRLTISPVISGTERQPEALDGATLPDLATAIYTVDAKTLLYAISEDKTYATVSALIRVNLPAGIPSEIAKNFDISVTDHPEAILKHGDGFIDIYLPSCFGNVTMAGDLPDFSSVEFSKFTVNITPVYQFFVAEEYRSLLTAPAANRLKTSAFDSNGIQTLNFDQQQFQADFDSDSQVSYQIDIAAEADTTVRFYNLQGVEIPATDMPAGLYIRRCGQRSSIHFQR